jgi:hypothetical protein
MKKTLIAIAAACAATFAAVPASAQTAVTIGI